MPSRYEALVERLFRPRDFDRVLVGPVGARRELPSLLGSSLLRGTGASAEGSLGGGETTAIGAGSVGFLLINVGSLMIGAGMGVVGVEDWLF